MYVLSQGETQSLKNTWNLISMEFGLKSAAGMNWEFWSHPVENPTLMAVLAELPFMGWNKAFILHKLHSRKSPVFFTSSMKSSMLGWSCYLADKKAQNTIVFCFLLFIVTSVFYSRL